MPKSQPPTVLASQARGRADLHLHTRFSDGTDTPERVVELAKEVGLSTIALTDHDNTEALAIAGPLAQRQQLELIPGIEMSASTDGIEVHLLGFFIDIQQAAFVRHLSEQQARRVARVHEMVSRLQRIGVSITSEEVLQIAGQGTVGRPHVARALLQHGYVSSLSEAFSRYLSPERPGFVPGSPVPPEQIIRLIRDAGGIPVLAHPIYLKRDELIDEFARQGLAGLEVYHSSHTPEVVRRYESIAGRLKLLKTGGSDYHGDSKEGVPVGASTVSLELVEELKRWKSKT